MYKHTDPFKTDSRPHCIWRGIHRRCVDNSYRMFMYYGGRGISVSPRWATFEGFWQDMGPSYKDGLTLDRIDNNGNYTPENCKWVTMKEQSNNRRSNKLFTIKGRTMTLAQWCDLSAVKPSTIRQRFYVYGWPIERALGIGG